MTLQQNQGWLQGNEYIRIVRVDRAGVEYKTLKLLSSRAGFHRHASKMSGSGRGLMVGRSGRAGLGRRLLCARCPAPQRQWIGRSVRRWPSAQWL